MAEPSGHRRDRVFGNREDYWYDGHAHGDPDDDGIALVIIDAELHTQPCFDVTDQGVFQGSAVAVSDACSSDQNGDHRKCLPAVGEAAQPVPRQQLDARAKCHTEDRRQHREEQYLS